MESWQVVHINSHLVDLQKLTICNVELLTILQSHHVLSQEDIEQLERLGDLHGNIRKASELYPILQTRIKGYEVLVKGLYQLKQSGALKILLEGYEYQKIYNPFKLCDIQIDILQILSGSVLFQKTESLLSNYCIQLEKFQDLFLKYLGGNDYFQLIQTNAEFVLFGVTVPKPLPYYIHRCIQMPNHQHFLKVDVFKKKCKDVFVIKGVSRAHLSKLAGPLEKTCTSTQQRWKSGLTVRFILLQSDTHFHEICLKSSVPTFLIQHESGKFKLVKSHNGDIDPQFIENSYTVTLNENQVVNLWKNLEETEHILLSDTPGMGKTEFMVFLANKMIETTQNILVIFIKFDELCKTLTDGPLSFLRIWEKLLKTGCKSYFGRQLLTELVKANVCTTLLFIDGFDEVLPKHKVFSLEILDCIYTNAKAFNIKIIISTRPHNRSTVEKTIKCKFYALVPFKDADQPECILGYWEEALNIHRNSNVELFANYCLSRIENKINCSNEEPVAGLPLQCKLIAEVYQNMVIKLMECPTTEILENLEMLDLTLVGLYQTYFARRLSVFDSSKAESVSKAHYKYAVELLFPDWQENLEPYFEDIASLDDILKAGIVEKSMENIRFVHRTFAEYLLAQFVIDIFNNGNMSQADGIDFVLNRVFTTLSYPDKVGNKSITSYQLIYPVICYFINGLMEKVNLSSLRIISTENATRSVELCYETLFAAVSSNYLQLFRLVRRIYFTGNVNLVALQLCESKVEWTNIPLFATKTSHLEMVEECFDFIENMPANIPETLTLELISIAAAQGSYAIFEVVLNKLIEKGYELQECPDLLRICIRDSKSSDVREKLDIIDSILDNENVRFFFDNMDNEGRTLVFEPNIHIDLLVHIAEKDPDFTKRMDSRNENIIHAVVKYLSPTDLHRFLTLPQIDKGLWNLLKMKNTHGHTAFNEMVQHMDPLIETIKLIASLPEFDNNHFEDQDHSLMATAVKYKRDTNLLKYFVQTGANMRPFLENYFKLGNEIHFSIAFGNMEAIVFFTEQGVDLFETNKKGDTPLEYAKRLLSANLISTNFVQKLRRYFIKHCPFRDRAKFKLQPNFSMLPNNPKWSLGAQKLSPDPIDKRPKMSPDFYGSKFKQTLLSLSEIEKQKSSLTKQTSTNSITQTRLRFVSGRSSSDFLAPSDKIPADAPSRQKATSSSRELASMSYQAYMPSVSTKTSLNLAMERNISIRIFNYENVTCFRKGIINRLSAKYCSTMYNRSVRVTSKLQITVLCYDIDYELREEYCEIMESIIREWSSQNSKEATLDGLLNILDSIDESGVISNESRTYYRLSKK